MRKSYDTAFKVKVAIEAAKEQETESVNIDFVSL